MSLNLDAVAREKGENDIKHLLVMPLVVGVVAIRHRLEEVAQQLQGFFQLAPLEHHRHVGYNHPSAVYRRVEIAGQQAVVQSHFYLLVREAEGIYVGLLVVVLYRYISALVKQRS